jgi:hypothetical protein
MLSSVGFIEETAKTHLPECDTRAEILTGCEELKRSIYWHNLDHHLPKTRRGPDHRLVTTAIDKLAWTAATAEPAGLGSAMTGKTSLWNLLQDHLSGYTSNDTKEEITSRFKSLSHQPTRGWNILKTTGLACASAAAATLLGNSVYYAPLGALAHQLTSQPLANLGHGTRSNRYLATYKRSGQNGRVPLVLPTLLIRPKSHQGILSPR